VPVTKGDGSIASVIVREEGGPWPHLQNAGCGPFAMDDRWLAEARLLGCVADAAGEVVGEITDRHGAEYAVTFGDRTYVVRDAAGVLVGIATLPESGIFSSVPFVRANATRPDHRRRGIQAALYDAIERHQDCTLRPSPGWHSQADVEFWRRRTARRGEPMPVLSHVW